MRVQSKVLRYFDQVGFGFLANPDPADDKDIYVPGKEVPIRLGTGKRLFKDELVEFEIVLTTRGPQAINLVILPKDK
jgi:cold shock CspA family protein